MPWWCWLWLWFASSTATAVICIWRDAWPFEDFTSLRMGRELRGPWMLVPIVFGPIFAFFVLWVHVTDWLKERRKRKKNSPVDALLAIFVILAIIAPFRRRKP